VCTPGSVPAMVSSKTTARAIRIPYWVLDALEQEAEENATTVSTMVAGMLTRRVTELGYVETQASE
jgi:hypothetical protein